MTTLSRSGVSSVKKATSAAEAPIWKAYLAIRLPTVSEDPNASNAADHVNNSSVSGNPRGRKRAKPSANRDGTHGPGAGTWMTLASPLTTTRRSGGEDGVAVLKSIRHYWERLSVNERQQILFLEDPELVKQLYKLNLSLLCVGLMQRHLKTSSRTATDTAANSKKVAAATATTITSKVEASVTSPAVQGRPVTQPSTRAATDTSSEKTYELLEAMEFMDIGTGILTVKTELAEDTDRLFTLVGDVLAGFLTSIHVLTESNFNKLFLTESETINTWENYQRLIAMLVEQLILRSYVSYLETEAARQMEQLLLEVSLEDKATGQNTSAGNSTSRSKKKSKKKRKKKAAAPAAASVHQIDIVKGQTRDEVPTGSSDDIQMKRGEPPANPDGIMVEEPSPEPMPELRSVPMDSDCQSNSSTIQSDDGTLEEDETVPAEPQEHVPALDDIIGSRSPFAGKRKFDEYTVSVPWEDVESDAGSVFDTRSVDGDLSDREDEIDDEDAQQRWRRKQRRREENAELEWQLQQVYASTSSLFGWDFSRQCELPDPGANLPWSESTLWRTAPKEVVRYFSPGSGDAYSRFHSPHFLPPHGGPPPSRYYFNPGPPTPFGPALLPAPGMEPMSSHLHGSFGFQPPEFPLVVSSPDFSNAQYHPSNHEDQLCGAHHFVLSAKRRALVVERLRRSSYFRGDMALLLRSVTSVAAKRATACALADAAATYSGVRGFASKKEKKKGRKGNDDANFEQMLRAIKGQYPDAEEWTEEEQQRHQEIGRRYNSMSTIAHNHLMRDLQTKIDLKWEAINALPAELQAEAMEIDDAPIPDGSGMATWTPPIPGFRRYTDEGDDAMD
ncbi:hypothetical protein PHYPSEUDO_014035 [Phytophthora pseudosyringae]|uniref:Uncharacterized protein n=1 Tax=Phytophthora pseudosyringae TaxID=221518 RepID=A0A8T1W5T8_9STRA|nr:hypothetical protein PHYPSEUDO_014035 [Phytophthora pseudosyringae]